MTKVNKYSCLGEFSSYRLGVQKHIELKGICNDQFM